MAPKSKPVKKTAQAKIGGDATPSAAPPAPDWPAFSPLGPREDLLLHELLPGQIVTISRFWTSTLCKAYVSFLSSLPLVTTPGKPKKGDAVRVNDRFQIDDPSFAERLWSQTGLKEIVLDPQYEGAELISSREERQRQLWGGEVLGLNPNIRIYRYSPGQFFDQHYDEANAVSYKTGDASSSTPARTTWTLLLYLTSPATGCEGGETVFYPDPPIRRGRKSSEPAPAPIAVGLETGMALLHRHGKECMLHEGREVTAGEKWVIRSDLCVKR